MKVCFVHLYYNHSNVQMDREAYLEWTNLLALPEEMARRGHEVHVVHLFAEDQEFVRNGVHFHFLAAGRLARVLASGRSRGREPALRAALAIRRLKPDIVHFHGIVLTLNLLLLVAALGRQRPPLVVQYHGGYPSPKAWTRLLQRALFQRVDRFLFGTYWHAQPFVEAGLLDGAGSDPHVAKVMEVSTTFRHQDRSLARQRTSMRGKPVFLWAGRLHPVKDPLTALQGFELILEAWPEAQLYLHYLSDEMLPQLKAFLDKRQHLADHVHFRGRVARPQMEAIYNSSDFLLQASRREFSGFVLVEAMACGVIPVVSDIPAFRDMTDEGRLGLLFPPGDAEALASRVLAMDLATAPALSAAIVEHFSRHLSFEALALQLESIYADLVEKQEHRAP